MSIKLNKGYWFEITDRLSVEINNIENNIRSHPTIAQNKELLKKIDKAITHLAETYTKAAQKI